MTPFNDRKRHKAANSGATGSQGAHLAASSKIVQGAEKIIGKNVEEMFAYRKLLESNGDAARVHDTARADLGQGFIF
ncbi:hypothetical protein [Paraburkholderia sp. HD33-4]|uniref:hypothetical protein n=1 Tax=Paraburkholderia sp. HD33-4 TaxID=2883242 RepID=UPI001F38DD08|nr:hypothetical protein [Paraburkholderia sp. HD33-4]